MQRNTPCPTLRENLQEPPCWLRYLFPIFVIFVWRVWSGNDERREDWYKNKNLCVRQRYLQALALRDIEWTLAALQRKHAQS